jgi:6-pyruvoyl-tetrahydropterin synthase
MEIMIFNGTEYNVYTEGDRDKAIREIVEENFESFNDDFIVSVMDMAEVRHFFDRICNEWNTSYANDIESEPVDDKNFSNRLEEEMAEVGIDNVDDFIQYLTESQLDSGLEGLQYYIDNFGREQAFQLVKENKHLIDFDYMAEMAVRYDSYGHFLNHYDGTEIEFEFDGETYFAYRV